MFPSSLMAEIRDKFAHVESCPYQGKRVFFENAGGALTLKSVVDVTTKLCALPDNQGRDNPASQELVRIIAQAKADMMLFFNASLGQVFVGESGTELLFRLISNACLSASFGNNVVGSTLEHPATRSAALRWAKIAGKNYIAVPYNPDTGSVDATDYARCVTKDTCVATIIHTSPVTGMSVDVPAVVHAIRSVSPACLIIVDGIQHASHGRVDIDSYDIDGYAISPYKVFSRHGYGIAWASDRLTELEHDNLIDGPENQWELGTRDTSCYAAFSEVVRYFEWLGEKHTASNNRRQRIEAAGLAIHNHEKILTDRMLYGEGNLAGLSAMPEVQIIAGVENARREGLVSIVVDGIDSAEVVKQLGEQGIRVHIRRADHYSASVLKPLGLSSCIRVSLCHYNSEEEVMQFLVAMHGILKREL